jgi:hypothetical protein
LKSFVGCSVGCAEHDCQECPSINFDLAIRYIKQGRASPIPF